MTTFSALGVRFALFEAPVEDASDFLGAGTCSLCKQEAMVCFEVGIGCTIVARCASCDTEAGLDAEDHLDGSCPRCGLTVRFPAVADPLVCCASCLQGGRAAITKDTELGMVGWEQAREGTTHGVPGLVSTEFEIVLGDRGWNRARVAPDLLFELIRTPTYSTLQGEQWLFCCREPMVFVGAWTREQFATRAPDGNGKALLAAVLAEDVPGLREDQLHDVARIYVFRCPRCAKLRGHWDCA